MMYILNILSTIKKMTIKKSKTLHSKTMIDELDLLKKTVIIQWNIKKKKKKKVLLLGKKLTEEIPDASNSTEF